MSYVLSSKQMKAVDKRAIEELGIPARVLMEIAGKGCADYLIEHFPEELKGRVAILHGAGNNSGDGFVIARWLKHYGVDVALVCVHKSSLTEDAAANYEICCSLKISTYIVETNEGWKWLKDSLNSCSMVIDAIFGIGFRGDLSANLSDLFRELNQVHAQRIAIDIPSGLNADTGTGDEAFEADCTLAIHAPKLGMMTANGKRKCGKLAVIPLGIPNYYNEDIHAARLVNDASHSYPIRYYNAHKGTYGHVAVIGGSLGYTGSVKMSAMAALRAGAGLVHLHSRMNVQEYYIHLPPEIMFIPIAEDDETEILRKDILELMLEWADAILIGPGLGLDSYAKTALKTVITYGDIPTVVDADAIKLIAGDASLKKEIKRKNVLLTPHWGEFCTLAKLNITALHADVFGCLQSFTAKTKSQILLKSDTTIFSDNKRLMINITGNDGLATGGSGDVLAGIIASFAAQGMELGEAAINASYLMGKTAEYLATKRLTPSILPTDIIENLFVIDSLG